MGVAVPMPTSPVVEFEYNVVCAKAGKARPTKASVTSIFFMLDDPQKWLARLAAFSSVSLGVKNNDIRRSHGA